MKIKIIVGAVLVIGWEALLIMVSGGENLSKMVIFGNFPLVLAVAVGVWIFWGENKFRK